MLASFLKVPKIWPPKVLKINVLDNPTILLRLLIGLHLRRSQYRSRFIHIIFHGGSERRICFETECVPSNGPSGSSKVVDFDPNRKRVCDFLLVVNSNLGPSCHAPFRRYRRFSAENSDPTPIPPEF